MNRNKMIRQLLYGIISISVYACNSQTTKTIDEPIKIIDQPVADFFDADDLGAFGSDTKLFLNAQFSECGEWGGHDEKITVFAKADKEFYLNYQKFKVNCDSISTQYGKPNFQKLEIQRSFKLNQENKKSISAYIQRMAKSKIEERYPGHAGNSFSVIKSDSTLIIKVYGSSVESYNQLLKELRLGE